MIINAFDSKNENGTKIGKKSEKEFKLNKFSCM